ncbi:MAG: isopentenyl-diphosphate delta-isomerase [Myxococcota bacterium]|jgi:isopentenyl-diphosphate delta-isomerase
MSTEDPNQDRDPVEDRKDAHLRICLEEPIERLGVTTGFERWRFEHDTFPELARGSVDISTEVFGRRLAAPIMIGAMTGGTPRAGAINRILAEAAQRCGVAMALGSQRKMIEAPDTVETFRVRDVAPDILLMGNVGAVQLNYGVTATDINRLISGVGADLFAFHLNPLQEAIQPEGDTNFAGLIPALSRVIPQLDVPVVLKEVGAGFSAKTLRKIAHLPFAGLETAGVGGTSWSKIETFRTESWIQQMTGRNLGDWGVPTCESLRAAVSILGKTDKTVICSGGIRSGLQVAKAVAMGADLVAAALPFLRAADSGGVEAVVLQIQQFMDELRTVCFVTGSASLSALRQQTLLEVT